jgi:hypothetical protein
MLLGPAQAGQPTTMKHGPCTTSSSLQPDPLGAIPAPADNRPPQPSPIAVDPLFTMPHAPLVRPPFSSHRVALDPA